MTGPDAPTDEEFEEQLRRALRRDAYSHPMPPETLMLERVQANLDRHPGRPLLAYAATAAAAVVFVVAVVTVGSRLTDPQVTGHGASPSESATQSVEPAEHSPPGVPTPTAVSPSASAGPGVSPAAPLPDLALFPHEPGSAELQARAVGVLAYDEAGCLVLQAVDSVTFYLAWPWPGTEWDVATGTVKVNGVAAQVGSLVALGGGSVSPAPPEDDWWVNPPADACWGEPFYLAFNIGEGIIDDGGGDGG